MSDLEQLLERVRAANGADDCLDYAIYLQFRELIGLQSYTSSIDAALALVERVLPGWFGEDGRHTWGSHAILYTGEGRGRARIECYAPTHPLAILAALLSALIAQRKIDADKD
jgi:hypothetical protein